VAHTSLGPGGEVKVVISDVLQQQIVTALGNQVGMIAWCWRVTSIDNGGCSLGEICEAMDLVWGLQIKPLISTSASYRGMRLSKISPAPPSAFTYNTTSQGAGTVTGDPLPKQTAGVITWYTSKGGPAFRGRSYFPFPGEADNGPDSKPTQSYIDRMITPSLSRVQARTVVGADGSVVLTPVIYHRESRQSDVVTTGQTRGVWGTQRRRGDYGKTNTVPF